MTPYSASNPSISPGEFAQFRKLIYDVAGIQLSDNKQSLLVGRLAKRLRHHGLGSFKDYFALIMQSPATDELQVMVDLMTTNETYFFREEKHFDFLRKMLASHPKDQPLQVWSAASSTGEEVYTLCMVLADCLGIDGNWTVTGSDISHSVLQVAAAGQYDLQRVRGLPTHYLHTYCLKGIREQEGTFLIDKRLRAHTRFMHINLKNPLPDIGPFDVIFLRNVMIYFDLPTKRHVVAQLGSKLKRGGYFVVGHSETLSGIADGLQAMQPTIYRKPL